MGSFTGLLGPCVALLAAELRVLQSLAGQPDFLFGGLGVCVLLLLDRVAGLPFQAEEWFQEWSLVEAAPLTTAQHHTTPRTRTQSYPAMAPP